MSTKYAALIEYDGSQFCGWQRQDHASSVQQALETALSKVADHEIGVVCAGRTDTGVHALGQVVHFESDAPRSLWQWQQGVNANLPSAVVLREIREVEPGFHARFSATSRTYQYLVLNTPTRSAIQYQRVTWVHHPLDHEKMQRAADYLLGVHDFTSFRALACQAKNPVREIYQIDVKREQSLLVVTVRANGFLHHMVRNIMGSLLMIGRGQQMPEWMREVLLARNRALAGVTAPPYGLYLCKVGYDGELRPEFVLDDSRSSFVYTY